MSILRYCLIVVIQSVSWPKPTRNCFKDVVLILINCGIADEAFSELMDIFNYFVKINTIHLDFNKLTFEDCVGGYHLVLVKCLKTSAIFQPNVILFKIQEL